MYWNAEEPLMGPIPVQGGRNPPKEQGRTNRAIRSPNQIFLHLLHLSYELSMSRLIVKNLPPYITDDQFRKHFDSAKLGTLTDSRLALRKDGTFRRFGFVGYKTAEQALKAQGYFDRSFIDTSQLQVEIVDSSKAKEGSIRPSKRPRLDRPFRDAAAGPSSAQHPATAGDTTAQDEGNNNKKVDQLTKFLELMGPRSKVRAWGNEDDFGRNESQAENSIRTDAGDRKDDDEEMTIAVAGPSTAMSDAEWLKSRMKRAETSQPDDRIFYQDDDAFPGSRGAEVKKVPPLEMDPRTDAAEDNTSQILASGRLFLRNLTFTCTEEDLRSLFDPYGQIRQIHIPLDSKSLKPKGVAFVRYEQPEHAVAAFGDLDGKDFQGRLLHIIPAIDRFDARPVDGAGKKKSLKDQTSDKRKADWSRDFNWAMLYMNSDAVVSSVADRLKISKSDILNAEHGTANPAVKLALAETHVIQETKKYLEEHGISVDAFQQDTKVTRSNTIILVKNIPYGTAAQDLEKLFGMHGEVTRLLIPPAGTMAVVEFGSPEEAKKAFRGVAYKRMKNSIIYLEWAPTGLFKEAAPPPQSKRIVDGTKPVTVPEQKEVEVPGIGASTSAAELVEMTPEGATLFVKNLNFASTSEDLVNAFKGLSGFTFARINMRPDPKRPEGPPLSMGYGFVGFKSTEDANRALKTMQGYGLDGHSLLVSFARRGVEEKAPAPDSKATSLGLGSTKSAKLLVRNVPFEASKKDIRDLFGAHGTLKSVRLPRKFDTKSRGFAFLEFVSRREAEVAMATLKHTHLLGRHLVLEWAKENEAVDVDELREKIKKGYVEEGRVLPGKKRKFRMEDEDDVEDDQAL